MVRTIETCGGCGNQRHLHTYVHDDGSQLRSCEVCIYENECAHQYYQDDCAECEAAEAERERRREERHAKREATWLAAHGGVCSKRPLQYRQSSLKADCAEVLAFLDQLCECQTCEDCGNPHNTGREEYSEDECQCLAGAEVYHRGT